MQRLILWLQIAALLEVLVVVCVGWLCSEHIDLEDDEM